MPGMTDIDFTALAAGAQSIPELSERTRVTKPNPFTPVVVASYNDQEPKQVGPLSPEKGDEKDARSPLELVYSKVASAAQKLKKDRLAAGEDVSVTTRKILDDNGQGWVQVFAEKSGGPVPEPTPERTRRGRG